MYKTLACAALLLAVFAFTSGSKSADASPSAPIGPAIVAKGKFPNQTAPIPTTTLFTPAHDGLYRASLYMTQTTAEQGNQGFQYWLTWVDDAGTETGSPIFVAANQVPPNAWGNSGYGNGGTILTFEAKAGQPVTYYVTQAGDGNAGTYSFYYTIERLE
jgi:hypothetical protein